MSLPSLSSVLRNIGVGLPGSPPGSAKAAGGGSSSSRRHQSRTELLGQAPLKGEGEGGSQDARETPRPQDLEHTQKIHEQQRQLTATPPSAPNVETPTSSNGGYRRRRHELEIVSDELDSPGSALSGCLSECSGSTATYAGGSCADRSGGGWASSSWDGSDHERWDTMDSDRQRHTISIPPPSVSPSGGLSATMSNAYGTSNSKRAKLDYPRPLSGMSVVGNGTRGRAGLVEKGRVVSADSLLEQGLRQHSQSHSTDEWRAMSKAARVLGVDSLEERDVEDQRRASMTKAARILGVDNAEELQQNAAASRRQMWAPPRSSASKAARIFGVEDVSELQREAARVGRGRSFRRKLKLPESGDGGSKPRQGSISSLIRALEHNDISGAEGQISSRSETEESKQETGRREHMETASALSVQSNRSTITRTTESCSSISDVTLPDGDAAGRGVSGARGGVGEGVEARHHQQQRPELLDDQMSGLQTPRNLAAGSDGGHGQGFGRHGRDEMEIETPPSQPRSAALTSLRQAPAPLLAPYTPSIGTPPYTLSPSPVARLGPGPSPAGSPCTPQMPTAIIRHASDFAVSGSNGERLLTPTPGAPKTTAVASAAAKEKGGSMVPASEATGDEANRNEGTRGGLEGKERRGSREKSCATPTDVANTVVEEDVPRDGPTQHRAAQESHYDCRSSSPLSPPATAGQALSWDRAMRSAPLPTPFAGCKEVPTDRPRIIEVKQEPRANPGLDGGWSQTEFSTASAFNGNAETKHRGWQSQRASLEFKHETDGLFPRQMGPWGTCGGTEEQVTPVSMSMPIRPESTFSAAYPLDVRYPQPNQRFVQHRSEHPDQYQQHCQQRLYFVGRSPGTAGEADPGIPLSNAMASDSSGESESMCETHPDLMEETEPAPSRAFEALAAMIPVVDPLGISQSAASGVKAEDVPVGVGALVAVVPMGKAKPRRRTGKVNAWIEDPPIVTAVAPVAPTTTVAACVPIAHSPVSGAACGVPGISTRKQQEVATRPREKGRFVKRPPAFLPYSAFKRSDESSADAAAEAAEAAEEAREKASEAAALAAVAAAAVASERRGGSEGAKSNMSPPSAGGGVAGLEGSPSNGWSRGIEDEGREGTMQNNTSRVASPSSPAPSLRNGIRQPRTTVNAAVGRGRPERGASPISRAAAAAQDIWSGEGRDRERPRERGKEKDSPRESNFSDCGSERSSDDLRGMAFLPWSPMDGPSPRASAWDSPRRNLAFSVASGGSVASTPSRAKTRPSGSGLSSRSSGGGDSNGSFDGVIERAGIMSGNKRLG